MPAKRAGVDSTSLNAGLYRSTRLAISIRLFVLVTINTTGALGRLAPVLDSSTQIEFAGHRLAIPQSTNDLQNVRPGRKADLVHPLEGVNGMKEHLLLLSHLALFGGSDPVGESTTRPSTPFKIRFVFAGAAIDTGSAIDHASSLGGVELSILLLAGHRSVSKSAATLRTWKGLSEADPEHSCSSPLESDVHDSHNSR